MLLVGLTMLLILVLAGVVATYVAFTGRGEPVPHAAWMGPLLRRTVDALPTLDNQHRHQPR